MDIEWAVVAAIVTFIIGIMMGLGLGMERHQNRTIYWCDNAHRVELQEKWYECRKEVAP